MAGAARDPHLHPQAVTDTATAAVIADAGRIGSASLTALNGSHWTPGTRGVQNDEPFGALAADVDTGTLWVGLCVLALLVSRPLGRLIRRQEQQRRATALASTLGHAPRG